MRALILAAGLLLLGCPARPEPERAPSERACRAAGHAETARFLAANRPRYLQAIERSVGYLRGFSIDPVALRAQGMKGKKKLVELLDALLAIHRYAPPGPRRTELGALFRKAASVTASAGYHDLGTASDTQLKEDATSYLRACYLMERMGLDTRSYRAEIAKVKPRLDAHLAVRGPHQRMAFAFYYDVFKLAKPPILVEPLQDSLIRRRPPPYRLSFNQAYDLTHEVFVPFDFGGKLDAHPFTDEERVYLRRALEVLAIGHLRQGQIDLVGELLACLRYLRQSDLAVYREGLDALLGSQRPNGAFGNYESHRARRGELLELDLYLHTTSVAMDVLPLAFEGPPVQP